MRPTDSNRRTFLRAAAHTPLRLLWPAWMPRLAFAQVAEDPRGDTLIVIFLRGAADALNLVPPHGEDTYYRARPTLGIPRPDDPRTRTAGRTIDLDGFFGLHPAMRPLLDAWQQGQLAIVHACGAPDESRSHFKAMELMERGISSETGPASGWLGRHLATRNSNNHSPLRAVGLGETVPRSLYGSVPVTALRQLTAFHLHDDPRAARQLRELLRALYREPNELGEVGRETLGILELLEKLDPAGYRPASGVNYPDSEFGLGLKQIAMLIKAEVGLEVATIDSSGWDTHFVQGGSSGLMAGLINDLATGLAALHADLTEHLGRLTVVVMSEFGRRVAENASLGTDHGHGGAMLLLGGNVVGGVVHGSWPGLQAGQLVGPGDLAVTTDYRDVLAEVCELRLGNRVLAEIFPAYTPTFRGIVRPSSFGRAGGAPLPNEAFAAGGE